MSPKPYQCGVCGKAFRTVQVLQKHTQTFHMRPQMGGSRSRGRGRGLYHGRPGAYRQLHTSQARFMCVMCNRSFRSPDLLQDHMTRSHMGQVTPVQLTQSQETFDPSSVQTSQAPATATLQSLQQQQQEQQLASSISFQSPDDPNAQLQMSQSDPSAFNVSTASTSGTFITPVPASMFQGLSAGASTSASQRSPNPSRVEGRGQAHIRADKRLAPISLTKVMKAILRTTGPALTFGTVKQNGAPFFRKVSPELFLEATARLQALNLGSLIELQMPGRKTSAVFIKKPPEVARVGLQQMGDVCLIAEYERRYNCNVLQSFPKHIRTELIRQGLVPSELLTLQRPSSAWT
ncbi:uncharacterized protein [Amphiura filiformis]|uniref:uncharacterized protein isoform X4 n=1 Tax=Amphiura filiformis TaxID=82378 RepID=UPI003B227938